MFTYQQDYKEGKYHVGYYEPLGGERGMTAYQFITLKSFNVELRAVAFIHFLNGGAMSTDIDVLKEVFEAERRELENENKHTHSK